MPLIRNGEIVEDTFIAIEDDAPLPLNGTIVSLNRFRADRETLLARNSPLGVRLKSSESPEEVGDDAYRLAVIALEFPAFRDGRPFSWARMLRMRMNYTGEIRATGHFLYDQLAFLTRVGVNAFDLPENFSIHQFNRALREVSRVYQPSADGRITIPELRHIGQRWEDSHGGRSEQASRVSA